MLIINEESGKSWAFYHGNRGVQPCGGSTTEYGLTEPVEIRWKGRRVRLVK
jgi:hypothetical protein